MGRRKHIIASAKAEVSVSDIKVWQQLGETYFILCKTGSLKSDKPYEFITKRKDDDFIMFRRPAAENFLKSAKKELSGKSGEIERKTLKKVFLEIEVILDEHSSDKDSFPPAATAAAVSPQTSNVEPKEDKLPDLKFENIKAFGMLKELDRATKVMIEFESDSQHLYVLPWKTRTYTELLRSPGQGTLIASKVGRDGKITVRGIEKSRIEIAKFNPSIIAGWKQGVCIHRFDKRGTCKKCEAPNFGKTRRLADLSSETSFPTLWTGVMILFFILLAGFVVRRFLRQRKSQQQASMRTRQNLSARINWPLSQAEQMV